MPFFIAICIYLIYLLVKKLNTKDSRRDSRAGSRQGRLESRRSPARSSDGHVLRGRNDITCRQYGHRHEDDTAPRYIVHDDPEDGYILLNGIKMRISEADKYENTI